MHSAVTNHRLKVSHVAVLRGALTLAVLSALLFFAVHPAQAQTESVLYNFTGTPDGANPYSTLTFQGGNIFGTTYKGGLYGAGTVFELTPNGTGGWSESVLYSFCPASPSCAGPCLSRCVCKPCDWAIWLRASYRRVEPSFR